MIKQIKFGTDGWRAVIAEDYTVENVVRCAYGVGKYIQNNNLKPSVVVGYDTRFGSEMFAQKVTSVLLAMGIEVELFSNFYTTPACSLITFERGHSLGIMITASHNPPLHNGFKIKSRYGSSANVETISEIENIINSNDTPIEAQQNIESANLVNPNPFYIKKVSDFINLKNLENVKMKVVADYMHGSTQGIVAKILENCNNIELIEIRADVNPSFPNMHQPEPLAHNLKPLSAAVLANKADVGIAFDGDGDRLGVVDERGEFVSTLSSYNLLALHLLKNHHIRGKLVCTVTMSNIIEKIAEKYNCEVVRTAVGFKYIAPELLNGGCIIGGEESGGYAFAGYLPERDGIVSGLLILEMLALENTNLTTLLKRITDEFGEYHYTRKDLAFHQMKREVIEERIGNLEIQQLAGHIVKHISHLDGIKIIFEDDTWVASRLSGTEQLARVYSEMKNTLDNEKVISALAKELKIY